MKQRQGFTLIEILIVIVIMLVMAGILYPVLFGARAKAQQVKCATQLRQIGMSIQMYSNDHDDLAPPGGYDVTVVPDGTQNSTPAPTIVRIDWQDILVETAYLRSYDLLVCPAAQNRYYRYSYGSNRWVMGWKCGFLMGAIPFPSNTVLLTEKTGTDWVAWEPNTALNNPYYFPLEPRHSNQLNVLFCDGHVKRVGVGEFIIGGNSNIIWRWQ